MNTNVLSIIYPDVSKCIFILNFFARFLSQLLQAHTHTRARLAEKAVVPVDININPALERINHVQ